MFARLLFGAVAICAMAGSALAQSTTNVTTYHNDTYRTGWNQTETQLTTSSVSAQTFGPLYTVPLDEQVDAQPLVYNNVVYAVTANNTVYAISPSTGQILQSLHLGAPVPVGALPGRCSNNSSVVGITSTPVIDPATGILYVVTYTYEGAPPVPVYRLRQIQLPQSDDAETGMYEIKNVVISAAAKLSDGTSFTFAAQSQRQRAGLLEANGNIYVAFASFCDFNASKSRGWVLGFNAGTLAALPANALMDAQTVAQTPPAPAKFNNYYLSSIWMSGYGVAADASGDLFFATGNSDTTKPNNLQNSVVHLSGDLTTVKDFFTPAFYGGLDRTDGDFGSGGVMLLPDQPGFTYAVAQGKISALYSLNRAPGQLGGLSNQARISNGYCWCGPSYFTGSDGVGRVVTSTSLRLTIYTVNPANPAKKLSPLVFSVSQALPQQYVQDPGFFTSISSNGAVAGSHIIWAVGRPLSRGTSTSPPILPLYAFDATPTSGGLTMLYSGNAGTWPHLGGNANIVPTVANGQVFVGSYKTLTIFGLKASAPQ